MQHRRVSFLVAVCLVATGWTSSAHANSRSWAQAKRALPEGPVILMGANMATIRKSALYKKYVPDILAKANEVQEGFRLVKDSCGIDVEKAVRDVVIAMWQDEKGAIFASVRGLTAKKMTSCLKKIALKKDGAALSVNKQGKIYEYSVANDSEKLYLAWLGSVVVMGTEPTDRKLLERAIGGKGAVVKKGDLKGALKKVKTSAAVWMAMGKHKEMASLGVQSFVGSLKLAKKKVDVSMRMEFPDPNQAQTMANMMSQMQAGQAGGGAGAAALMQGLKVSSSGSDVIMSLKMAEADLMSMISVLMAM